MADFDWTPRSAVASSEAATGRLGRQDGRAGIVLRELTGFDLALVASRRGMSGDLAGAFSSAFATSLPAAGRTAQADAATVVWSGPDQYLFVGSRQDAPLAGQLSQRLGAPASVSDQSDARCLIAIAGQRVRDALAKLVSIDLEEVAFPVGAVAATVMEHTNVTIWRATDGADGPRYLVLGLTSFAGSVWHAICEAGAEFGVDRGAAPFAGH